MCGIAMVRLLKPLDYYQKKYGTWQYGLQKMYLLMEKQHNRGQEGAGIAGVKLDMPPGEEYIWRERIEGKNAIQQIFANINEQTDAMDPSVLNDVNKAKKIFPFAADMFLGHLRYSTTNQKSGVMHVHPFLRRHNWKNRTLVLAGNFNLTNVDELFNYLTLKGQHPRDDGDTFLMLEQLGYRLDMEVQKEYDFIKQRYTNDLTITQKIEEQLDIASIIRKCEYMWDGGYVITGMLGHGDSFVFRDSKGIRPCYYYADDEIVVVASERPVIQTSLNVKEKDVHELTPGNAMIIKKNGDIKFEIIREEDKQLTRCSFERIYFSRGSDYDIYRERKLLGESLAESILKSIDNDVDNSVFSFIPNTAEVAFYGMIDGIKLKANKTPRTEKVLIKDIKLRTFISQNKERDDLATHVYDITYGSIRRGKVDNLIAIDDSIVRGTTLKQSLLKIMNRLEPKKIVIVSSSPQVRFPDYYGIDMSKMSEFCAFLAAIQLLKDSGRQYIIDEVYKKSKAQEHLPKEEIVNFVTEIYAPFTQEQISTQIAKMLTPPEVDCPVELVYQTIEGLHKACPHHLGDWYFTGNYPTPGGNRLVNKAFINYYEGKEII
ncbi:MAG: amidophosphoribosyltransferase [Paludibacter sp.]|nr:amidophosphoribosyltransferase [Paludibacter sp.]MDD4197882.1 amidophosphoribosyltransferase [Paludibacter sp.]